MIDEKTLETLIDAIEKAASNVDPWITQEAYESSLVKPRAALIEYVLANSLKDKPVLWADRQADGRPDPFCIFPESLATDEMRGPWNWIPLYMKGSA